MSGSAKPSLNSAAGVASAFALGINPCSGTGHGPWPGNRRYFVSFDDFVCDMYGRVDKYTFPEGEVVRVWFEEVGELRLPTGDLVVADPAWIQADLIPESGRCVHVQPGVYPVEVACLGELEELEGRVYPAASRVRFSDAVPSSWHPARTSPEGSRQGVNVDSGTIALADWAVIAQVRELPSEASGLDRLLEEALDARLRTVLGDLGRSTGNLVVHECALGDGIYVPWIGRDADGAVVQLVLDLGLVGWEE